MRRSGKLQRGSRSKSGRAGEGSNGGRRGRSARTTSGRSTRATTGRRQALDTAPSDSMEGLPFKRGFPLSVKIASFTAALVAFLMIFLGVFVYRIAAEEIDGQINRKGATAARMLIGFADPLFWFNPFEQWEEETNLHPDPVRWQDQWDGAKAVRLHEHAQNLEGLVHETDGKILFIQIVDISHPDGARSLLTVSHDGKETPPHVKFASLPPLGGVKIAEGRSAKLGRLRRFTYALHVRKPRREEDTGPASPAEHKADGIIYMRANEVDEVKNETLGKVAVATGVGLLFAVALSIGVSMFLASPLTTLVHDMRVVARGNLDHQTHPRSRDEIGYVAHQFNEMTGSLKEAQKLAEERAAIENELSIATEIQTKLLPERIPQIPGVDLFSYYLSAKEVGGDYYDFLVIDQNHLGIVVADVSGKGIPGAMVMTMVRSLLRMASVRETSPAETLKKVNRILAKDIRRGMFVTAFYGVLNVVTKQLTMCSAGHNPLIYYNAQAGKAVQVNPSGIALGFDKGRTFDENLKEQVVQLAAGDRFVVYTDGVVEAMNASSEEFGMQRFAEVIRAHTQSPSRDCTNAIVQALEKHRGDAEQSDDITVVTLRVT